MAGLVGAKGGIPRHINGSTGVSTTKNWTWSGGIAGHLWFKNTGGGTITLTLTNQTDADAGIGISIGNNEIVEFPIEIQTFFTRSTVDRTFEAIAFIRRG